MAASVANSTINGSPVIQGRISRPRVGNWTAEIVVDAQTAAKIQTGAAATLLTDGGALTFIGTVLRSDAYANNVTLRMVGGTNKLAALTKPRFYQGVQLIQPLQDALSDAGYKLSQASTPAAVNTPLGFWTMVEQPVAEALTSMADAAGADVVWRILSDGSVFFGEDGFIQSALTDFELIDYMPLEGLQVIASEAPDVNPGESFNGRHVSVVEHLLSTEASRVRLWYE